MEDKRIVVLMAKAQELGWKIAEGDTEYEFQQFSPAGEDFQFCIDKETNENADSFIEKIRDTYIDFDPEEHVKMWMDAKSNGIKNIPSLYALVHDADDIEKMLGNLSKALESVQYVWTIGFSDPNTGEKLATEIKAGDEKEARDLFETDLDFSEKGWDKVPEITSVTCRNAKVPDKDLKPYKVTIRETLSRIVVIWAANWCEAEEKAEDLCNDDVISLQSEDFDERECKCSGEWAPAEFPIYEQFGKEAE